MNEFLVHRHQQNFNLACKRVENDPELNAENKKVVLSFAKMRLAKGASRLRVVKCMYSLRFLGHWLKKPFSKASKNDLIELTGELENKHYSENTKYDFKVILKLFYKWLKGNDEEYPQEIKWLKPKLRNDAHKLPEEMLTEQEVLAMVAAADNPRDKALILVLYETGCRIGELLGLRMKNIQFDQYGAILRVTGKTGDRRVRIISSAPALTAWLNVYAKAREPDAPLWPPISSNFKNKNQPMEYSSIYGLVKKLSKRAGIAKRVYAHLFRHSRATFLASKLTEAQMKEYFGWTHDSEMAGTYVHLSGRDVDQALLALQGLNKPEEKREELVKLKNCQRCKEPNSPSFSFCTRCGNALEITQAYLPVLAAP